MSSTSGSNPTAQSTTYHSAVSEGANNKVGLSVSGAATAILTHTDPQDSTSTAVSITAGKQTDGLSISSKRTSEQKKMSDNFDNGRPEVDAKARKTKGKKRELDLSIPVKPDEVLQVGVSGAAFNISSVISSNLLDKMTSLHLDKLRSMSSAATPKGISTTPAFNDTDDDENGLNDDIDDVDDREEQRRNLALHAKLVGSRGNEDALNEWLGTDDYAPDDDDSDVYSAYRELLGLRHTEPVVEPTRMPQPAVAMKNVNFGLDETSNRNSSIRGNGKSIGKQYEDDDSSSGIRVSVKVNKIPTEHSKGGNRRTQAQDDNNKWPDKISGDRDSVLSERNEEFDHFMDDDAYDYEGKEAEMEAELRELLRAERAERDKEVPKPGNKASNLKSFKKLEAERETSVSSGSSLVDFADSQVTSSSVYDAQVSRLPSLVKNMNPASLSTTQLELFTDSKRRPPKGTKSTSAIPILPDVLSHQLKMTGVRKLGALAAKGSARSSTLDGGSMHSSEGGDLGALQGLDLLEGTSLGPISSSRNSATKSTLPHSGAQTVPMEQLEAWRDQDFASDRSLSLSHTGSMNSLEKGSVDCKPSYSSTIDSKTKARVLSSINN